MKSSTLTRLLRGNPRVSDTTLRGSPSRLVYDSYTTRRQAWSRSPKASYIEQSHDDDDGSTTMRQKTEQPSLGLIQKDKDHGHLTDVPLTSPARLASDVLIGINVFVFCLQLVFPEEITGAGIKMNAYIDDGQYYRLLTAAFLHGSPSHLLLNMLSLHSLGSICEWTCGKERFLAMYMISAIMGNVSSYYGTPEGASLGASGAVFGLAGALIVYFARNKVIFKDKEIPQGLVLRLVATVGFNFMIGSLLPNIDEYGHLGGLVTGMVISMLLGPAYELCYIKGKKGVWLVDNPPLPLVVDTPHLVYLDEP